MDQKHVWMANSTPHPLGLDTRLDMRLLLSVHVHIRLVVVDVVIVGLLVCAFPFLFSVSLYDLTATNLLYSRGLGLGSHRHTSFEWATIYILYLKPIYHEHTIHLIQMK